MKTVIILSALIVSTGTVAQTQPVKAEQEKAKTQIKQKAEAGDKAVKEFADQKQNETTQKVIQQAPKDSKLSDKASDKAKDMVDTQGKKKMADKKVNQGSAAGAKAKAKSVKTEAEAEDMIDLARAETKKTITSIDENMTNARLKLAEQLETKEITQAQFQEKIAKLMEFEKRKNTIINSMK